MSYRATRENVRTKLRYPNSRTNGHTAILAAWKRVCYVTEYGGVEIEKKRKMLVIQQ